jgi:Short C-terminal domain/Phospholipase_D-nuclease N-terminal
MAPAFASTFTFGDALIAVLEFALLFFWIWILIAVVADIFRSHDLSGWGKAGWLALIVIVPLFGVLIYLVARGDKMKIHEILADRHHDAVFRQYVRNAAGTPRGVVVQLEDLRDRGVLTDDEFQRAKDRALS